MAAIHRQFDSGPAARDVMKGIKTTRKKENKKTEREAETNQTN
jgi:hypothetical protein